MVILSERTLGGKRSHHNLTDNSFINSMFLITDTFDKITIYWDDKFFNDISTTIIRGIEFNDQILIGSKYNSEYNKTINLNKQKYFDSIEVQSYIYPCFNDVANYIQAINYININYNNAEYIFGNRGDFESKINVKQNNATGVLRFMYPEKILSQVFLSGVAICNFGHIMSIQIIETIKGNFNDDIINSITYGKGDISIVEANVDTNMFKKSFDKNTIIEVMDVKNNIFNKLNVPFNKKDNFHNMLKEELNKFTRDIRVKFKIEKIIMDYHMIGFEEPSVFILLLYLLNRILRWSPSNDAINVMYPHLILLIDKAIEERDFKTIHSVKRMDRFINNLIYNEENKEIKNIKNKLDIDTNILNPFDTLFSFDKGALIKLGKMWNCLVEPMDKCQRIHLSKMELNSYQVSLLSSNYYGNSIITLLCQLSLISLIGINFSKLENTIFPILEGKIIIPVIFIFTLLICWKQLSNTLDFRSIFPEFKYKLMGWLDLFSNVICAIIIVIFNFFLLAFNTSVLDIVLNSMATLFIIELDDLTVFITQDTVTNLYKQQIIKEMMNNFKKINPIYFDKEVWIHDLKYILNTSKYHIDKETMEIVPINNEVTV